MNYKIKSALDLFKKNLIIFIILWIFIAISIISPFTYSKLVATKVGGNFDLGMFFDYFYLSLMHPFQALGKISSAGMMSVFFKNLIMFTFAYIIMVIVGIIKTAPKGEYSDIEHGSSDWCQNGEQYAILNSKKGIILAEDNYLPVDKRGNVNVLVVGRFRFW